MTDRKKSIFQWNHIDSSIDNTKIEELKSLYRFYHRKFICHKLLFKYFKKADLTCNISAAVLVVTGTIVGGQGLH